MNCISKREYAAYTIRPKIHRLLPEYLRPVDAGLAAASAIAAGRSEFHTSVTAKKIPDTGGLLRNRPFRRAVGLLSRRKAGSGEAAATIF